MMETKLARISQLSKANPDMVFTSVGHFINEELLKDCHRDMDGKKAVGIDGVTKEEYEKNLDENVKALTDRLKGKSYKPKPARRVEIPKDNGKTRPLNIYCYEDKLVQEALKRILEAVFEPMFYNEMMGFRPNRGCHQALKMLNGMIMYRTGYIVDADIRSFFDHMDHEYIIRFVESRIKDPNITRLLRRLLKSGIMVGTEYEMTEEGSGQGSVCSPIISCIYMHYVLLWWFKERIEPNMRGYCGIVNYADDFVCCFQYKEEAEQFYKRLEHRMKTFGLSLAEEKCRIIEFGRFAEAERKRRGEGKPETFDFLGFTHYCSTGKNGKFRVKRKTSRKKFRKKCKEVHKKIGEMRTEKTGEIIKRVNLILTGYYHYYAIIDNWEMCGKFRYNVLKSLHYWLNRRSQKRSYTWEGFLHMIDEAFPLVRPKSYINLCGYMVNN